MRRAATIPTMNVSPGSPALSPSHLPLVRLLDASRPAAEQVQVFQAIGWPSGPPSAGYLKNKLVARAEQRYQTAYDRIAGRHPGLRVCFPMTVGAYARAGMGGICDPVYTLSHDSDAAIAWRVLLQ